MADEYIGVTHNNSPFVTVYPWSAAGFGAKFSDPATLPTFHGQGIAFSPNGDALVVGMADVPYIHAYAWSALGFGTKFADPSPALPDYANGIAFSPAQDVVFIASGTSPRIYAYAWSAAGFGAKFSDPATLPAGAANAVAITAAGDFVAVAHNTTPFVSAYPWSGAGFGTKFTDPATLPTSAGQSVAFSPSGDALAVAHSNPPHISVYAWSGAGFGSKFADPSGFGTASGADVAFTSTGDAIAVAVGATPFINAYAWSAAGFGAKFSDPATLPAATARGVAFGSAAVVAEEEEEAGTSEVRYLERWALESQCVGGTLTRLADSFVIYSGSPTEVVTGLPHLEGKSVVVWADGVDVGTDASGNQIYTVADGQITLATPAANIVVGLAYTAQWKSGKLLEIASAIGATLTRHNRMINIGLVMADVHAKGLQFGPDFDSLDDLPETEDGATVSANAVRSEYDHQAIEFPGRWGSDARLCFQAKAPRPVTILAAVVEADVHD